MRRLLVVGLSHRTAPIAVREQAAIPPRDLPDLLPALCAQPAIREAVILSTCNRVEVYAVSSDSDAAFEQVADLLARRAPSGIDGLRRSLYRVEHRDAVRHLFRVTAGLDSMILGESEVAAQVKQAYLLAHEAGTAGPTLHRLFQKALHSSKLIRSRTGIAEGQASVGSVVAGLAKQRFGERLGECEVLLWGAGKAAEATTRHLASSGIKGLWIVNRTQTKARDLALLCQGGWLSWEQALHHLAHVDIAIICTQAPHYVVDRNDLEAILPRREGRPLFLIDLAVPRNVEPSLASYPGVQLWNIDDLQAIAQAARAERARELGRCETHLEGQVTHFVQWWNEALDKEGGACQLVGASSWAS